MKILWLCNFNNKKINQKLNLNLPDKAPWITMWIDKFANKNDIELHIVSPNKGISLVESFELDGINYHFFNYRIPFIKRAWPLSLDARTNFILSRFIIKTIVNKISPDLIHLIGAENAYYSSAYFDLFKHFPILIGLQTFMSQVQQSSKYTYQVKRRIINEKKILSTANYIAVHTDYEEKEILKINPTTKVFRFIFELFSVPYIQNVVKRYDFVFFGRNDYNKGVFEAIKAISLIKRLKDDVSMIIIGSASKAVKREMQSMIEDLNLSKNITVLGNLLTRDEVHKNIQLARISILPSLHDISPATITESILLKIPVLSYSVGAIPEFNKIGKIVHLAEPGNTKQLTEMALSLLNNYDDAKIIAEEGRKLWIKQKENVDIYKTYLKMYDYINKNK